MYYKDLTNKCISSINRWIKEQPTFLFKNKGDETRYVLINKEDAYLFNLFRDMVKEDYPNQAYFGGLYNLFSEFSEGVIEGSKEDSAGNLVDESRFMFSLEEVKQQIIAFLNVKQEDEILLKKYEGKNK